MIDIIRTLVFHLICKQLTIRRYCGILAKEVNFRVSLFLFLGANHRATEAYVAAFWGFMIRFVTEFRVVNTDPPNNLF